LRSFLTRQTAGAQPVIRVNATSEQVVPALRPVGAWTQAAGRHDVKIAAAMAPRRRFTRWTPSRRRS
jgi:hypothetical protein